MAFELVKEWDSGKGFKELTFSNGAVAFFVTEWEDQPPYFKIKDLETWIGAEEAAKGLKGMENFYKYFAYDLAHCKIDCSIDYDDDIEEAEVVLDHLSWTIYKDNRRSINGSNLKELKEIVDNLPMLERFCREITEANEFIIKEYGVNCIQHRKDKILAGGELRQYVDRALMYIEKDNKEGE